MLPASPSTPRNPVAATRPGMAKRAQRTYMRHKSPIATERSMPVFTTTRRVKHSPEDMFALVADVERYAEFVPMCTALKIRRRSPLPDGREVLLADMSIGYKFIRETFTSRVTLDPAGRTIFVEYVDGPFQKLENRWTFKAVEGGCDVVFFIDYAFKSRTFSMLAGAVFDAVFRKMAEAFETRADVIYAKRPAAV
jgi:coenzyme Q-binding protein COQ10